MSHPSCGCVGRCAHARARLHRSIAATMILPGAWTFHRVGRLALIVVLAVVVASTAAACRRDRGSARGPEHAAASAPSKILLISIDTMKATVAARALDAGADIINDVSALESDPSMAGVAAEGGAGVECRS